MRRRDFITALTASVIAARFPLKAQETVRHPRILIADADPFTGLHILKARYAAGRRPSEDMEGWALSWQLTGQSEFAERALAEIRKKHVTTSGKASRSWLDYTRWALVFDWLYNYRWFRSSIEETESQESFEMGPSRCSPPLTSKTPAITPTITIQCVISPLPHSPPPLSRAIPTVMTVAEPGAIKVRECLDNVLDISELVSPEGSYHESMDYMRITWASLVLIAELQRTTTGIDPAQHFSVFRNIGNTYLYKLLPDGTPSREGDNEYPVLDSRDTTLIGYSINRFKDPYSAWLLRHSGFFRKQWVCRCWSFCGTIRKSRRKIRPWPPKTNFRATVFSRRRTPRNAERLETGFYLD